VFQQDTSFPIVNYVAALVLPISLVKKTRIELKRRNGNRKTNYRHHDPRNKQLWGERYNLQKSTQAQISQASSILKSDTFTPNWRI
jgi:hypothetical protein